MIAEIQTFESPLLSKEYDHHTAGPIQPFAKELSEKVKAIFKNS